MLSKSDWQKRVIIDNNCVYRKRIYQHWCHCHIMMLIQNLISIITILLSLQYHFHIYFTSTKDWKPQIRKKIPSCKPHQPYRRSTISPKSRFFKALLLLRWLIVMLISPPLLMDRSIARFTNQKGRRRPSKLLRPLGLYTPQESLKRKDYAN